ncbi:MAG: SWIM zinc finger family protein, partial [Arachidicoccus sp.]|nr:SWIM zinc finger family protein [Arachidicoccus sp.]
MALSSFIKYIYNNGTDEVIRRGKHIFTSGNIQMAQHDELAASIRFRVKDDMYATWYYVHVSHYKDEKEIMLRCNCSYNLSDICKHEAAVLFQLQQMSDRNLLGEIKTHFNQRHTTLHMKKLDLHLIRIFTSPENFQFAEEFLRNHKAVVLEAKNEKVIAEVAISDNEKHQVIIQKNKEKNFDTGCDCDDETNKPLCKHKTIVLLQLLDRHGANYFDSIRNWDREKNQLLGLYGFSLDDDLKNKFEFTYKDGKPFLRVLDPSIKRVAAANSYTSQP